MRLKMYDLYFRRHWFLLEYEKNTNKSSAKKLLNSLRFDEITE